MLLHQGIYVSGLLEGPVNIFQLEEDMECSEDNDFICCMVLHKQMFLQGLCMERNKTSGLTALKLYSAFGN